ncbi:MAG TPA: ABC transporter permease, partial [Terriglobia bacterium]|nr:ABC transporter permease [Terriglobia bacterium]
MKFELLVAVRYLRAKRTQSVISMITFIAILGVTAGVTALVVALAVSEGQREDIQDRLLGVQAHLNVLGGDEGIPDYRDLAKRIEEVPGVIGASPRSEGLMAISPRLQPVQIKGIFPELESKVSHLNIIKGQMSDLTGNSIVIGKELANRLGLSIGDDMFVMSPETTSGPAGPEHLELGFKVVAIFSIGLYEYDSVLA